jgi:hypothetical protein
MSFLAPSYMFWLGCQLVWNCFATGHGKGKVDGAGALLKQEVEGSSWNQMLRK